jgi:ribulose-5-phosphate 4-epimerase/fuculose-1-phosphate aldolase
MKFKINRMSESKELGQCCEGLVSVIVSKGHAEIDAEQVSDFVLNLVDLENPRAFRRKDEAEKVISVALVSENRDDMKSVCYTTLVRTLSNMMFCIVQKGKNNEMTGYSITPEVGFTEFVYSPERMFSYIYPIASSHFVLRNRISTDIRLAENQKVAEAESIIKFARILDELGVLPAPFPINEFLDQPTIDHLYRLYQIKGLSYGNLSIRNESYPTGNTSFWMTARGVNKSQLKGIGQDILLVTGYDSVLSEMLVSVTEEHNPRIRVSVDAIEHFLIYDRFPGIGAIVHVHAWYDGINSTTQVFPCGTRELAENAVNLLQSSPVPEKAVIGLKNHGITITGPDINDIFDRIRGRLIINVPMFS